MQTVRCQTNHERNNINLITQLSMVGYKKLHSPIWSCMECEKLTPFPDVDSLLNHLKEIHTLQEVNIDNDGGAWISETITEATN